MDESSRIKHPGALRTKAILKFGQMASYRRILTGTPITKGAEDLYSQFRFLDPYILKHDSFYSFRARYCVMGGFESKQVVAYQNLSELTRNIEGHSFRVLKRDCLDLPDKIYQRHPVELSKNQRRLYDQMRKEFVAEMDGERVDSPLALTRILRLQQIVCGWFPGDDGVKAIDEKKNPRLEALLDIISNIDSSKVIIWSRFRADQKVLECALKQLSVSYHGGVPNDERATAVKRFQEDPDVRFFIGNPATAGLGLNLTAASYAIYYSNSFDLETRLQSEDRCHRIGTKNNVTYIDLEAPRTVDSKIIKALRAKKSVADLVNQDPVAFFMEDGT